MTLRHSFHLNTLLIKTPIVRSIEILVFMRGGTLASILFRMPFFYFNTFNKETMKKTSNKLNKKNIKGIIKQVR